MSNESLHDQIMHLPCTPPKDANVNQMLAYKSGHRDARRAAAELAVGYEAYARQAAPVDVPDDLRARCAELLAWRDSGVLSGDALRSYAKTQWYADEHNSLQMAEQDTARQAYALLSAAPTQPAPQRKFSGPGYLEQTGYVPAGSAAEREAASSDTAAPPAAEQAERDQLRRLLIEAGQELKEMKVAIGFRANTLSLIERIDAALEAIR